MVLPSDLCIKQENEVHEHETSSGANYDIKIKLEIESSQVYDETDWCIDNKTLFKTSEECEQSTRVVDYEQLTEYSKHECLFCNKVYSNKYYLICHNLTHLKLQLMPIKTQNVSPIPYNDNKSLLKERIQRNNKNGKKLKIIGDNDFKTTTSVQQCNRCDDILPYKSWHSHQKEVHGIDKYVCAECNKQFKTARTLEHHHMYVHLGQSRLSRKGCIPSGGTFKCSECPSEFDHKTKLTLHIRFCHCEKVRCKICMSVMKKNNLSNHMRRLHHSGTKHACHCGKKFKSPSYLKVHIKYAHTPKSS